MSLLLVFAAGQCADHSASFGNHQCARGSIPRRQSKLPERVEPTRGNVSKIQRCGPGTPNSGGRLSHCFEHPHVVVDPVQIRAVRKTSADQRSIQAYVCAHTNTLAIELRTFAARGGEEFLS